MASYRKIDPRIWNDERFRVLTDSGKLAFLFVLTHPSEDLAVLRQVLFPTERRSRGDGAPEAASANREVGCE